MNFVFDVDGTLTPTRQRMDEVFSKIFLKFCRNNLVYIVTGSDWPKTVEQLGNDICFATEGIFNCSGNVYSKKGICIYSNDFTLTQDEIDALEKEMKISGFTVRTGNHIEKRIGMVNFSIVGRNANQLQRQQYIEWDGATNERELICSRLNELFPRLECVIGGETGVDITLRGYNKAQIRKHIVGPIVFFADKCEPGGNDYPLAKISDIVHNVKNWEETEFILRMKYGRFEGG